MAESAQLREELYPGEGEISLGYAYAYKHIDTLEQRLAQGGVRLAAYLEWLFSR